jgi:hypothetical protein
MLMLAVSTARELCASATLHGVHACTQPAAPVGLLMRLALFIILGKEGCVMHVGVQPLAYAPGWSGGDWSPLGLLSLQGGLCP